LKLYPLLTNGFVQIEGWTSPLRIFSVAKDNHLNDNNNDFPLPRIESTFHKDVMKVEFHINTT
jgi:hypothetical protein